MLRVERVGPRPPNGLAFLVRTLVGVASQHYRAEIGGFFGCDSDRWRSPRGPTSAPPCAERYSVHPGTRPACSIHDFSSGCSTSSIVFSLM